MRLSTTMAASFNSRVANRLSYVGAARNQEERHALHRHPRDRAILTPAALSAQRVRAAARRDVATDLSAAKKR
jgi:hypothetical protein